MVWNIHPEPTNRAPENLLEKLIQDIPGCDIDSKRIEYRELFSIDTRCSYIIRFTRYSSTYAFGVLRRSSKKSGRAPLPEKRKSNMIKLNLGYRKLKKEDIYSELLHYLDEFPELRERLLAYFYMMEKPRADIARTQSGLTEVKQDGNC